jgi:hypothetical protein
VLDAIGGLTVAADMGGELVCPAARHRKLRQLAELVAYTGLASESRDLARGEGHVPNGNRPSGADQSPRHHEIRKARLGPLT